MWRGREGGRRRERKEKGREGGVNKDSLQNEEWGVLLTKPDTRGKKPGWREGQEDGGLLHMENDRTWARPEGMDRRGTV